MDKYANFATLMRHESDYLIELIDRGSMITILAPHGGAIEPHTTEIAQLIADTDYNFYSFTGQKPQANQELHITSHHWNEQQAIKLVSRSTTVVAVHGCKAHTPIVFLGGRDTSLRNAIANELRERGILNRVGDHGNSGMHRQNICNRSLTGQGVQLELPRSVRDNQSCWPSIVAAVRTAIVYTGRTTR